MPCSCEQEVAGLLAPLGIADHHRHDVGLGWHHRKAGRRQHAPWRGAALRCCASRSADDAFRWRIEASAAAATAGGSAVVKMKPGA